MSRRLFQVCDKAAFAVAWGIGIDRAMRSRGELQPRKFADVKLTSEPNFCETRRATNKSSIHAKSMSTCCLGEPSILISATARRRYGQVNLLEFA